VKALQVELGDCGTARRIGIRVMQHGKDYMADKGRSPSSR
jgi:hypothetical protein